MARVLARPVVRIVAVLCLAAMFFVLLTLQETDLRRERANSTYLLSNNWALSQLEYELERFLGTLDRYMLGVPEAGHGEVSLRFDILWSRVPILLRGPQNDEVRRIDGAVERLTAFGAALAAVEPDLAVLVPGDLDRYRGIRERLTAHREALHELTLSIYSGPHFLKLVDRTQAGHQRAMVYQFSMLAVVAVLALLLGREVLVSTRRARNEAAARQAAEAASLAKSNFLAAMSHELRTPLNAIMGFAEIQERQIFGPMPARYHGYARDIHASADHLLAILNAILDMARIEASRTVMDEEEFDPADALNAAVRMIDGERERSGQRLVVDIRTAAVALRADRRMFRQIVLNLLSNAVKFTPAGGTVTVSLSLHDGDLGLCVQDTGIGISPDDLARVSEPFFQADQSPARRHQGTGLGLSLVKGFVALHAGSVTIDSVPGEGTTVTVRFPADRVLLAEIPLRVAGPASG